MINKILAIYPGRFQPMAKHHAEAFTWLQNKFGAGNTYIATSDIVDPPKSPFSFKEKREIISKFGFGNKVVQTKRPYKAEEITYKFNPDTTAVVYMVGEKDMKENPRFKIGTTKDGNPTYFQDYEKNKKNLQGFETHAYLIVAPHISLKIPGYGEMSGTEVRNVLSKKMSVTDRPKIFRQIFGWYDTDVADMMLSKLNASNNMKEQIFTRYWWKTIMSEITEGYPTAKQTAAHKKKIEKLKSYLRSNIGKEFVYDFNEFPKTVYGVKIMEGGASGHMDHVFDIDWVKTGNDLIQAFEDSINYLTKKPAAVKIDGINTSIRLVNLNNKRQFVLDRGSMKPLDVQGVTKNDLLGRFGEGHGMIKIGGVVLDIFNKSLPKIAPALKKLGLWDNPNILLNIEYVSGSTNVVAYSKNFLAIHGLLELYQVTEKRRATKEIAYDKSAMQDLINNLVPVAEQYNYEVLGSIDTRLSSRPNLSSELNKPYTIVYDSNTKETKSLRQWLSNAQIPNTTIKTVTGKTISALSKEVLTQLLNNIPLDEFIADPKDYKSTVDGFFIYLATMKLGDVILEKLTSTIGDVKEHEGIVIRDQSISPRPFKITGGFILKGLESTFRKS